MNDVPQTTEDIVAVSGDVWNDLAQAVNWLLKLRVGAGLQLLPSPGGPLIAMRGGGTTAFHVKVDTAATPAGLYNGFLFRLNSTAINPATGLSISTAGTVDTEAIYVLNLIDLEMGSGHMLTDSPVTRTIFPASRWYPGGATDGKRVAILDEVDYQACDPTTTSAESMAAIGF